MKRNIVFDYNSLTTDYLKETHSIKVLSYFYFEFMKFDNETKPEQECERIYDVCFIGSKNEPREKLIQDLQEKHPDLKFYVDFEWKHKNADSLTKILQQCKVVLNIPYYMNNPLETHRIHKALACGCGVVSLKSADEDANEFYKDYITITDDISNCLVDGVVKGSPLSYEELIKNLSQKFNPHMCFIIEEVHKKLLSISNGDKEEVVHESTATDTNVSNDEDKEIPLGDEV